MNRRDIVEAIGGLLSGWLVALTLMLALGPPPLLAQVVHTATDVPCAVENLRIS